MMSCFRRLQDLGNYRFGFTICGSWTRELKKPRRRWGAKHVISYMFFSQWRWIFWKQHGIVVVVSITKMMTMKFGIENITTFCFCTSFEGASFQRYGRGFWSFQELLGLWDIRSAAAWTTNRLQKTPIHSTVQTHPSHSIRAEHHSSTPGLKSSNQLAEALFAFIWSGSVRLTQSRCCHLQTCRLAEDRQDQDKWIQISLFVYFCITFGLCLVTEEQTLNTSCCVIAVQCLWSELSCSVGSKALCQRASRGFRWWFLEMLRARSLGLVPGIFPQFKPILSSLVAKFRIESFVCCIWRVAIFQESCDSWPLLWCAYHVSMQLQLQELALPALKMCYRDFARWQRREASSSFYTQRWQAWEGFKRGIRTKHLKKAHYGNIST